MLTKHFKAFPLCFFVEKINMSILRRLSTPELWETFYIKRTDNERMDRREAEDLRAFIDAREYLPVIERIEAGIPFPFPHKKQINKMHSNKKRIIYTFDRAENYVLKLLAQQLHAYDGCFGKNLYSFRNDCGVRHAIADLTGVPGIDGMYAYKADIHDYFNSVDVSLLLPLLRQMLGEAERDLFEFLRELLENEWVLWEEKAVRKQKGIMAGVPVSSFLANLYLADMDAFFAREGVPYARYSDDVLLFAPTRAQLEQRVRQLHEYLAARHLRLNPEKEAYIEPGEPWNYLGFSYCRGVIDVSPVTIDKLKGKMKRKARALQRWRLRKGASPEQAIRAYIRHFNRKFFANTAEHELTWCRWFFPVINTVTGLKEIDHYMQQCIRFLVSGKYTKANYNLRYETMRQLGYRSLVGAYYQKGGTNCKTVPREAKKE